MWLNLMGMQVFKKKIKAWLYVISLGVSAKCISGKKKQSI